LLQLQKTYKGDERFNLTTIDGFDVNTKSKRNLPSAMLGALNKREEGLFDDKD
jgi:hypothetical protein